MHGNSPDWKAYRLYRDGQLIYEGKSKTFVDTGLLDDTTYTYEVRSVDYAGNESTSSNSVAVTTGFYGEATLVGTGGFSVSGEMGGTFYGVVTFVATGDMTASGAEVVTTHHGVATLIGVASLTAVGTQPGVQTGAATLAGTGAMGAIGTEESGDILTPLVWWRADFWSATKSDGEAINTRWDGNAEPDKDLRPIGGVNFFYRANIINGHPGVEHPSTPYNVYWRGDQAPNPTGNSSSTHTLFGCWHYAGNWPTSQMPLLEHATGRNWIIRNGDRFALHKGVTYFEEPASTLSGVNYFVIRWRDSDGYGEIYRNGSLTHSGTETNVGGTELYDFRLGWNNVFDTHMPGGVRLLDFGWYDLYLTDGQLSTLHNYLATRYS